MCTGKQYNYMTAATPLKIGCFNPLFYMDHKWYCSEACLPVKRNLIHLAMPCNILITLAKLEISCHDLDRQILLNLDKSCLIVWTRAKSCLKVLFYNLVYLAMSWLIFLGYHAKILFLDSHAKILQVRTNLDILIVSTMSRSLQELPRF